MKMIIQRFRRFMIYMFLLFVFFKFMLSIVNQSSAVTETEKARLLVMKDPNNDLLAMISDLNIKLRKDQDLMAGLRDELGELRALQERGLRQANLGDSNLLQTQQKAILQRQERLQMVLQNLRIKDITQHEPLTLASEESLRREMEAARYQAKQERLEKLEEKKRMVDEDRSSYDLEDFDKKEMTKLHLRTYRKLTDAEIQMYYTRESTSQRKYGTKVLDVHKDRNLLMDLFPGNADVKAGMQNDRVSDQIRVRLNVRETKTIFIQSKSDSYKTFNHQHQQCNVAKCNFTSSLADLKQADAVYVENPHFLESIQKDLMLMGSSQKPKITVSFQIESPQTAQQLVTTFTNVKLNWTASYRTDSVLNTPYERFTPFLNATGLPKHPNRNYAEGKSKMVAWFVSNCHAGNGRQNYADELEKYVAVDVYGLCGTPCPKMDGKTCFDLLDTEYRFYLAFENSNCKDYVTEKVYNALKHNVIPIVFGARREDYARLLPPNSFIHIDDFDSPKTLAKYLLFLSHNDHLYNQYFLWKDTGRFIDTKFMCRLCTMVHLAPHFPMWYSDANRWWRSRDTCVDPTKDKDGVSYGTWKHKQPAKQHVDFVRYGYERRYKN